MTRDPLATAARELLDAVDHHINERPTNVLGLAHAAKRCSEALALHTATAQEAYNAGRLDEREAHRSREIHPLAALSIDDLLARMRWETHGPDDPGPEEVEAEIRRRCAAPDPNPASQHEADAALVRRQTIEECAAVCKRVAWGHRDPMSSTEQDRARTDGAELCEYAVRALAAAPARRDDKDPG